MIGAYLSDVGVIKFSKKYTFKFTVWYIIRKPCELYLICKKEDLMVRLTYLLIYKTSWRSNFDISNCKIYKKFLRNKKTVIFFDGFWENLNLCIVTWYLLSTVLIRWLQIKSYQGIMKAFITKFIHLRHITLVPLWKSSMCAGS